MQVINDIDSEISTRIEQCEIKQHFICDEKFQLLRQCQQHIFEATEISPSIRKLVNEIINAENLNKVKEKYLIILNATVNS